MSLTHHWSGVVSRYPLKANKKGGLAVSLQPGPNAAFIINQGSSLWGLWNEQYIYHKTTDLLEHLYKHQTLNSLFKKAEMNPIWHDIRKVKIWNMRVKSVSVNLWPQKLTQITCTALKAPGVSPWHGQHSFAAFNFILQHIWNFKFPVSSADRNGFWNNSYILGMDFYP